MTREEARKAAEVMMAYADGKDIEYLSPINHKWKLFSGDKEDADLGLNFCKYEYRIKPKLIYRPFKNTEECWNEMLKHQPFGWVINKYTNEHFSVTSFQSCAVTLSNGESYSLYTCYNEFAFADATPFGIKDE